MTEQEAKWYLIGDRIISPDGPTTVYSMNQYDFSSRGSWQVVTRNDNGQFGYWVCADSLHTFLGHSAATAFRHPPPSPIPSPQECAQTDRLEEMTAGTPADPPRPLCPVEGERETVDWEAHRRFMRGLG